MMKRGRGMPEVERERIQDLVIFLPMWIAMFRYDEIKFLLFFLHLFFLILKVRLQLVHIADIPPSFSLATQRTQPPNAAGPAYYVLRPQKGITIFVF